MGSIGAELLKVRKRPAMWILVGIYFVMGLFFGFVVPYLVYKTGGSAELEGVPVEQILQEALPQNLVPNVVGGFPLFGGAIALIVGALIASSEYGWGTLKTILIQRPRRAEVLAGKLVAAAIVTLGITVVFFLLSAGASWIIAMAESRDVTWPGIVELLQGVGAGWLILGMWSLFGMTLGILFRSTALAIGLGLVWALVIESLISGFANILDILATIQQWLPGVNAGALAASLGARAQDQAGGVPGVTTVADGPEATALLIAYVAAMALISTIVLRRQDIA